MMSPNLFYQDFLLCIGVASLIFGLFLLFFKAPANNIYQPYRRSKSLLAAGYLVMSLNIMFWGITFDDRFTKPDLLDIYNEIIAFYLLYIIFNYALCNLLDHHYLTRRRLLTDAFRWVGVIAISALSMLPLFEKIRWGIAALISFLLIEYIVSFLYKFRKLYLHNDKVMANYFADDKRRFVAWTNRLILLMVVYGLLAFISIFQGIWFNFFFQCYALVFNFFVVISFLNHCQPYGDIEKAYMEWEEQEKSVCQPEITHSKVVYHLLESKLKIWVAREKYTEPNLTLDSLSTYVGTNHTYLSRFLKETHGVNFSEWVSGLRVSKAKELMRKNPKDKLENVAYLSGFSSLSYFSKVFSHLEGVSPARWRDSMSL